MTIFLLIILTVASGYLFWIGYLMVKILERKITAVEFEVGQVSQRLQQTVGELEEGGWSPLPLQCVYDFELSLSREFWTTGLSLSKDELDSTQPLSAWVTVTVEKWRGFERILVQDRGKGSSTTTITRYGFCNPEHYTLAAFNYLTLWEQQVTPEETSPVEVRPQPARIILHLDTLGGPQFRFGAIDGRFGSESTPGKRPGKVFFEVPLSPYGVGQSLAPYKVPDDEEPDRHNPDPWEVTYKSVPWQIHFRHRDEDHGLFWNLWVRDLQAYADRYRKPQTQ